MVVGGGIAGMQASLDLADQGFKVYLIENKSAIGGKMAQLDKTFPTNDCAMCTISPKLVETARHPNIEIMTTTEVLDIQGHAGDFQVRVEHKPRYILTDQCIACNDCVDVCPVIVPNPFNEGLSQRRAVYKLYPQATPNAYAIDKLGIAPCRDACPAGQRAQGYIALIREGRWDDALRVIKLENPFPGICGRICNHRCETACNRGQFDEPINIRALKRFVTDKVYEKPRTARDAIPKKHHQKVAIIGAGPCGLTAAQDLALAGYPVSIFEAMPVAGGMLRLGVPEFRLPSEIIEREVQDILDLGVELYLNHMVNNLDDLFEQGFDAVLIAVGAHEGIRLPIPGASLEGVLINTHFLRDIRLNKYQAGEPLFNQLGDNILVLGGGNVAIDCARSAVRLGKKVSMACLESREAMPAHQWEVQAALEEGITIYNDLTFEEIKGDQNGQVTGVSCSKVASFSFDEVGKLHLEKVPNSLHTLECDTVIFSVGQRAGLAFLPDDTGVGLTSRQTIAINPNTYAATRPGVFAAGDSVSGTAFVIEAVDSGHKAADSIMRYLQGSPLEPSLKPELPVAHLSKQILEERAARGEIHRQARIPLKELSVSERVGNFAEVELGYDDESAQREAARCLACGICSECMSCVFACGRNAIDHNMTAYTETLDVGAVILAPGYQTYQAEMSAEYGLGRYPNVVTSLQYERLLSASGPTQGHVQRPSDGITPNRIAFLQCVGSRDQNHDYCSAVCCMYATKEAIMTKEHHPETQVSIFLMDMRAFSKGYWGYFERSREKYGVEYHYSRISMLQQQPESGNLLLSYSDETGKKQQAEFDMVVLSVGMEISKPVQDLGKRLGIKLDRYGFCHTAQFNPLETSKPGIYAIGPFREPKDIPESVVEASGAAAASAARLASSRFSLTQKIEFPPERDISQEEVRIGVFVCHCGSNIAGYLDVNQVAEHANRLPHVVHAECNLYTCSQDSIKHITSQVKELNLNRVVVASCTPLTHQPLFQDSIREAGLNPYLFEMANIRNQCSWVHSNDREVATTKAKELVQMAVSRAAKLVPQHSIKIPVVNSALVVGGGAAGLQAAISVAEQGYPVHLVEQSNQLGGNLRKVNPGSNGRQPQETLEILIEKASQHPAISIHLNTQVNHNSGFMGNFKTTIQNVQTEEVQEINHGAAILATGAQEYRGPEYTYGTHPSILTQQELEEHLTQKHTKLAQMNSIVMVQCVGPAETFCSRICCTVAIKNALALKKLKPNIQIIILYRDIRTYGFKEKDYTRAREAGIIFMRYPLDRKPEVSSGPPGTQQLEIKAYDQSLQREFLLRPDLLVLSMPIVPRPESRQLAKLFKVALDEHGFFLEAHVKLRPVDFSTNGIFMAGMAHYPKLLEETLIQAQAAAARAVRVLSRSSLTAGGRVAVVSPELCTGCLTCVRICPFNVPQIDNLASGVGGIMGAAYIEAAVCQGCGICAAECPARAIQLMHYTDEQVNAKLDALLEPLSVFIPIEQVGIKKELEA